MIVLTVLVIKYPPATLNFICFRSLSLHDRSFIVVTLVWSSTMAVFQFSICFLFPWFSVSCTFVFSVSYLYPLTGDIVPSKSKVIMCVINKTLLPVKLYNFAFFGSIACVFPIIPTYMGFMVLSHGQIAIIYGIMPFVGFLSRPITGKKTLTTRFEHVRSFSPDKTHIPSYTLPSFSKKKQVT